MKGVLRVVCAAGLVVVAACVGSDPAPITTPTDGDAGGDGDAQRSTDDAGLDAALPPADSGADAAPFTGTPATLSLTGWWRANFTVAPWRASASAGGSANVGDLLATGTGAPTAGDPQNAFTPAAFTGGQALYNLVVMSTLFSTTGGTVIGVYKPAALTGTTANIYSDPTIWSDSTGSLGLVISTAGMTAYLDDGSFRQTSPAPFPAGGYGIFMMRWDGTTLGLTVNSRAELSVGCGNPTTLNNYLILGEDYNGDNYIAGSLLELMTIDKALSNADYANVKSYVNTARLLLRTPSPRPTTRTIPACGPARSSAASRARSAKPCRSSARPFLSTTRASGRRASAAACGSRFPMARRCPRPS